MGSHHGPRAPAVDQAAAGGPAQLDATIASMRELGELLDETRSDALIAPGIDHLETFFLNAAPLFATVTDERATASYAGHHYDIPVLQPLAKALPVVRGQVVGEPGAGGFVTPR